MVYRDSLRKTVEEHLGAFFEQHGFTLRSSIMISDFPYSRLVYVSDKHWIDIEYERGHVATTVGASQFQMPQNYFYEGRGEGWDRTKSRLDLEYATFLSQALEYLRLRPVWSPPDWEHWHIGSLDKQVKELAEALIQHGDAIFSDDLLVEQIKNLVDYRRQRADERYAEARAKYEATQAAGNPSQPRQMNLLARVIGAIVLIIVCFLIWFIAMSLYQPQ